MNCKILVCRLRNSDLDLSKSVNKRRRAWKRQLMVLRMGRSTELIMGLNTKLVTTIIV